MRIQFMSNIEKAMSKYSRERLDGILNEAISKEEKLIHPDFDISIKADFFLLACGYGSHDGYDVANMLYYAYDGVKRGDYTENQLINAVKKRLMQRKIKP